MTARSYAAHHHGTPEEARAHLATIRACQNPDAAGDVSESISEPDGPDWASDVESDRAADRYFLPQSWGGAA